MAAPPILRPSEMRGASRATAPLTPKTAFCKHRSGNGQFCNRTAHVKHGYCWQHVRGLTKKVAAVFHAGWSLLNRD